MQWSQQDPIEIPKFNLSEFMMDTSPLLGIEMYHWLIWLLIFVFSTYIFNKVFRQRKLPVIQSLIVYILLALGGFMLLIFEVDANLPIVYSLGIAVLLLLIVRIRYWVQERAPNDKP